MASQTAIVELFLNILDHDSHHFPTFYSETSGFFQGKFSKSRIFSGLSFTCSRGPPLFFRNTGFVGSIGCLFSLNYPSSNSCHSPDGWFLLNRLHFITLPLKPFLNLAFKEFFFFYCAYIEVVTKKLLQPLCDVETRNRQSS